MVKPQKCRYLLRLDQWCHLLRTLLIQTLPRWTPRPRLTPSCQHEYVVTFALKLIACITFSDTSPPILIATRAGEQG